MTFYEITPWNEPGEPGRWAVRRVGVAPGLYLRGIVSWHRSWEDAADERDRLTREYEKAVAS